MLLLPLSLLNAKREPSLPVVARDRHPSSGVWLTITPPTPLFFVSVAAKGLSNSASLLFATLTREFVSVAAKGLTETFCLQEMNSAGREDLEGVRRTAWRGRMVRRAPSFALATAGRQRSRADLRKPL